MPHSIRADAMQDWKQNIPNYLTYFRIVVIPLLVFAAYLRLDWLCALLFFLAGVTDWLDGYVARLLKAQSNVGRFLDPIADKLLVATSLILLVSHKRAGFDMGQAMIIPAILIVCREILVSGLREYLAELRVSVPVSRLAKYKTAVQMAAIFLLLLGPDSPDWLQAGIIGNILLWAAAILTLVTGYAYCKIGWKHM